MNVHCTLPDAKLVVAHDRYQRMLQRCRLAENEALRIPFTLYQHRSRWISPWLAADLLLGLPNDILVLAINEGDLQVTHGGSKKRPRLYCRVGDILEFVSERKLRCNFRGWTRDHSYLRNRYKWPVPKGEL